MYNVTILPELYQYDRKGMWTKKRLLSLIGKTLHSTSRQIRARGEMRVRILPCPDILLDIVAAQDCSYIS
jgi:hypothetical protein